MQYKQLGDSKLQVSEICLGTMTFGEQNSMSEAHTFLDYAVSSGVNFIDTAEMYPVPTRAETQGRTEEYIGHWLKRQQRDKLILTTKIAGPGRKVKWIRGGPQAIDRANIEQALNDSLRRLQTDYIDLYVLHWPDRYVPMFGRTTYDPAEERRTVPILEQLQALDAVIKAGKVRYIGVSNETPWGLMEFVKTAEQHGLPKVAALLNSYCLANRTAETGLVEVLRHENVGLVGHSPLGFGVLTGKYLNGSPPGARLTLYPEAGSRYRKPLVNEATAAYAVLAKQHGMLPSTLALAFARTRWFMSSVVIGITSLEQLQSNLNSINVTLDPDVLKAIDAIHKRCPNPAP